MNERAGTQVSAGRWPHKNVGPLCTSPFLHKRRTVGLPRGWGLESMLQGQVLHRTGRPPPLCAPCTPLPTQPCKLPELNSTHISVEGELFARYMVSARRVSYESVFKYVTGSINRDLL